MYRKHLEKGKSLWENWKYFFEYDLWYQALPPALSLEGLGRRLLRYVHLIVQGMRQERFSLHTASLTFSTLISLLPMLTIVIAIAEALGHDQWAIDKIQQYIQDYPEQFKKLIQNMLDLVLSTDFRKLGALGALFLITMIIQVLSRMEASFNSVWGISQRRKFFRRATDYISIVIVVPILLLTAVTVTAQFRWGDELFEKTGLLRLAPYLANWLAFSFLYAALPNIRVKIWPALASGFAGAVLWQFWLRFYIMIQPGVTNYNVLYGALASIPIFLAWLHISWFIILLGAQITFAVQTSNSFKPELSRRRANLRTKILIALATLQQATKAFNSQESQFEGLDFCQKHGINPLLMTQVLTCLTQAGILVETDGEDDTSLHVLARNPKMIRVDQVIELFIEDGDDSLELGIRDLNPIVSEELERTLRQMKSTSVSLDDLANPPKNFPQSDPIH